MANIIKKVYRDNEKDNDYLSSYINSIKSASKNLKSLSINENYSMRKKDDVDCSLEGYNKIYNGYLPRNPANAIGSIVMNCNPFTLGHKYLIEQALALCRFLYVFIVEEDKSYFRFQERLQMAKEILKNYENVCVFPGGKLIISSVTLPGYFEKEDVKNIELDASADLDIFCTRIAPELDISIRFAGSEPLCRLTNQYNQQMKKMLPIHGINFIEIPRLTRENQIISASKVRMFIKNNDILNALKLVPPQIYKFIIQKYIFEKYFRE